MTKKKAKLSKFHKIRLNGEMKRMIFDKNIRAEEFRRFITDYDNDTKEIKSGDWRRLKEIVTANPSLQLVGQINSGKSHLARLLVQNDMDHVYIVLDSHSEYDFLPRVQEITAELTRSVRLKLPREPDLAKGMFPMYYNLFQLRRFPKHYVIIIEEAFRYEEVGLKKLMAESRKFLKVLAIMQDKLYNFIPAIKVEPFNKFTV